MKHAFTPCRECKVLTRNANGLCELHQHSGWEKHQQRRDDRQGYAYGSEWRKLRARVLARDDSLCQECLRHDITRIATEVDHIVPTEHGGTHDLSNLQALCRVCHKTKTGRERMLRARFAGADRGGAKST